jgi:hypothetical protein
MRTLQLLVSLLTILPGVLRAAGTDDWLTLYERSGGRQTARYDETVAFCRRLASASPRAQYTTFGTSPQQRPLPLMIVSRAGAFTPAAAAQTHQAVVLIQAGIHAGEIDGKDAGLQLLRDILIHEKHTAILDSVIILFIPILNVDGHERFGPYNRFNQNGPEEMGWRTTAQNLNLNRDYMKADAPEMRALLRLFSAWLPDFYFDCHVTDGIDMQYDLTYAVELGPNINRKLVEWTRQRYLPSVLPAVEASGHPIFWYVYPREDRDPSKGVNAGASTPRFSTGYAAIQNRPSALIETHALKPYATRVSATYHFLRASLETIRANASLLRRLVREADRERAAAGSAERRTVSLKHTIGPAFTMQRFRGIRHRIEPGEISGGTGIVYTGEPYEVAMPFYDQILVADSVTLPAAYIIPPEWSFVPELLTVHGIHFTRLVSAETLAVEMTRFSDVRFGARPYEGRQTAAYTATSFMARQFFPTGSIVVPTDQRASHVAVHLLEPRSGDSFAAWGFFNPIFEQKEYAEEYIMESVGKTLLHENPALKAEFDATIAADTAFARNPGARVNWLYLRSPWGDATLNIYPVGRIGRSGMSGLRTVPALTP